LYPVELRARVAQITRNLRRFPLTLNLVHVVQTSRILVSFHPFGTLLGTNWGQVGDKGLGLATRCRKHLEDCHFSARSFVGFLAFVKRFWLPLRTPARCHRLANSAVVRSAPLGRPLSGTRE